MNAPRMLLVDVETSPSQVWTWDYWGANISAEKVIEPSELICWAAGWYDSDEIMFRSIHRDGKEAMVREAWELCNEAAVLIHFNGKRFNWPKLQHSFLIGGLPPPSPVKHIDLYAVAKKFSFTHNSLKCVLATLGLDNKREHEGFSLWTRCLAGDVEAWSVMEDYNRQDVAVLRRLYEIFRPWVPNHPSMAVMTGEPDACAACGSAELERQGHAYTQSGRYARVRCKSCGKWSRARTRDGDAAGVVQIAS